jgi:uncharacterized GH25 family protein
MRKLKLPLIAILAFSGLHSGTVFSHDFWIEPQSFRPAVGEAVPIVLRVGEDFTGTSQPLIPQWFSDYTATGPEGTQPILGNIGDDPAGSFTPDRAGNWIIGYRSTRSFVAIDPDTFNKYLQAEGLDWVMEEREARGEAQTDARELYSRCAKSLVRAGDASGADGFDTVLGYRLELIPELDPHTLKPGDKLPLRLLYEDQPIADILIIAFTAENPDAKQQVRTDADGRVSIALDSPGTWLIKGVHIIELPDTETRADWESFWASLTFELDNG